MMEEFDCFFFYISGKQMALLTQCIDYICLKLIESFENKCLKMMRKMLQRYVTVVKQ